MKITKTLLMCLTVALLSVPTFSAQDLSKYRNFSLGGSLAAISKEAGGVTADQVKTLHQKPKLIQQFTVWPVQSSDAATGAGPVQEMEFSFCDGRLYNITVTYQSDATRGLTSEDLIKAISADYGVATRPVAASNPSAISSVSDSAYKQVALWQDSERSVNLSVSPLSQSFQLVILTKPLEAEADAAIAAAEAQDRADAPQRENARLKQEAEDLQAERNANLKAFRP
ncbi:MAG: hypothetical protein ACRD40_00160 [Candidatus Acidiferrales bacterium]